MAWDIERGAASQILPQPWQTDTCLGSWHYDQGIFDRHRYKSAKTVFHMLADIVSKNRNLLLSVPLKGDGAPDPDEIAVVEGIAKWMEVNQEAIHGTRPWKVLEKQISEIVLLGSDEKHIWSQTADALVIEQPEKQSSGLAIVFKLAIKR